MVNHISILIIWRSKAIYLRAKRGEKSYWEPVYYYGVSVTTLAAVGLFSSAAGGLTIDWPSARIGIKLQLPLNNLIDIYQILYKFVNSRRLYHNKEAIS